jgi:hypothetical protein
MDFLGWVFLLIGASVTVEFCAACCGGACPEEDVDIVIAGTDPCALNCHPTTSIDRWLTATVNLTGGRTLTYTDLGPFQPSLYTELYPIEGAEFYGTEDCDAEDEDPIETGAFLSITLVCHLEPNGFGKRLGVDIRIQAGTSGGATVILADLDSNDADWFGFDEEVEITTPCGTFTLTVPSPA